jgi:hypothetical protein
VASGAIFQHSSKRRLPFPQGLYARLLGIPWKVARSSVLLSAAGASTSRWCLPSTAMRSAP